MHNPDKNVNSLTRSPKKTPNPTKKPKSKHFRDFFRSWEKFAWWNKLQLQTLLVCAYTVELAVLPVSCWGEVTASVFPPRSWSHLTLKGPLTVHSAPNADSVCVYFTNTRLSQYCLSVSECVRNCVRTHPRRVCELPQTQGLWLSLAFTQCPSFPFSAHTPAASVHNLWYPSFA